MLPEMKTAPLIVPVFLPQAGCPHQCVFCNQFAITGAGSGLLRPEAARHSIETFLARNIRSRTSVQIAFFGGNFLGLRVEQIRGLLNMATDFVRQNRVDGIRFSTRPDTVRTDTLDAIREFPVQTVELGVQSMNDAVLAHSRRGHTSDHTRSAFGLLRSRDYEIGAQIMAGLPADSSGKTLQSARELISLRPDFVRIYPTVVLKNSPLAEWYAAGNYQPVSLESCVTLVKKLYILFRQNRIPVIRMGLQATEDLNEERTVIAGPYHPSFGHLVFSEAFLDAAEKCLSALGPMPDPLVIRVHSRDISKMRGYRNRNIQMLQDRYKISALQVSASDPVEPDHLQVHLSEPVPVYPPF
jgi:histone acetyltransferase (RNA polymerase elongator complex component)